MKKFLMDLIARKKAEMADIKKRSDASQDLAEVRALGETLSRLAEEIADAEAQLAEIEENGDNGDNGTGEGDTGTGAEGASRSAVPTGAQLRNAQVVGSYNAANTEDETSLKYRNAFMNFVLRGTPIPTELRANENTLTSDVQSVIPTELVNQIIEKFDEVGTLVSLITKTYYAAGVEIPVSTVKPVAVWVSEGAGSDRQKKTTTKISFTYHKLRCEISMSMEVGTMALSAFEAKFVENVAKAMIKAIEEAVINGTGEGQPKGILKETVADGQAIAGELGFAKLAEVEGALPSEYEAGAKWVMNKQTFAKILGLVDANKQPIARVNYGVGAALERAILGRDVVVTNAMPAGKAIVFDLADYVLNTIYDMGISKKQDWDTEDMLTKAVMSVDGKVVDNGSLVTLEFTDVASV